MDVFLIGKWIKPVFLGLMLVIAGFSPAVVFALGVGGLTLESSLNKPLEAKIEVLGIEGNELETLAVNLAAADVYERMGIERTSVQEQLKFRIDQNEKGETFIRVYTVEAVNEPFLNFLVEVNWASGRLLREFTVLLDPPTFEEEEAKPVETPEIEPAPAAVIEQEAKDFQVPSPEVVVNAPPIEGVTTKEVVDYGPIRSGENLWKIAGRIKPSDVSLQQMMVALFRQNPEAFFRNNPSMLKEGAVLRLDDIDAARSIPIDEAIAEMAKHHQDWLAYRRERSASKAIAADTAGGELHGAKPASEMEMATPEKPEEAVLKLVTPSSEEAASLGIDSAIADKLETDLNAAKIELAMANELLEATRQENNDLKGRINALESQLQQMNSLIELRDKEMQLAQEDIDGSDKIEPVASLDTSPDDGAVIQGDEKPEKAKTPADLFKDPYTVGTIVGVVILLLLFAVIVARNKARAKRELKEEEAIFADSHIAERMDETEAASAEVNDLGFATSEPEQATEDFIDPISEADVYIAYGKYDKAEELLQPAIEQNPERHEIKLKLLEVYSLSGNKEEFEARAEELYAALAGDKQNPLWLKAVELAEPVCPNNPLMFGEHVTEADVFVGESEVSEMETLPEPAPESMHESEVAEDLETTQIIEKDLVVGQSESSLTETDDATVSMNVSELELSQMEIADEAVLPSEEILQQSEADDTLVQETVDVESLGMSELEVSQLEPEEEMEISSGRISEPTVTENGLTSMLEEFDEPGLGEIGETQSQTSWSTEEPSGAEKREDTTSIDQPSTEVVSVGYDSYDDVAQTETLSDETVMDMEAIEEGSLTSLLSGHTEATTPEEASDDITQPEGLGDVTVLDMETMGDSSLTSTLSEQTAATSIEESSEEVSNIFEEDSVAAKPAEEFDDTSMFLLADEVGTKLDLARAYIEMGDKEGAVELLKEVEDEGNDKQKADAQDLLALT